MSPAETVHKDAASQRHPASSILLDSLPAETLIEILSHTDFDTFDAVRATSQHLRSITNLHWYRILPGIISRDFHPVPDFFATLFDADVPPSLTCAQLLMVADADTLDGGNGDGDGLHPLLALCRVVRRWEAEFPRLRFASAPMFSRGLRAHEGGRLRGGLYLWWKFARVFHGHRDAADAAAAAAAATGAVVGLENSVDARRGFMRRFSSARLHEAFDLWYVGLLFLSPGFTQCYGLRARELILSCREGRQSVRLSEGGCALPSPPSWGLRSVRRRPRVCFS